MDHTVDCNSREVYVDHLRGPLTLDNVEDNPDSICNDSVLLLEAVEQDSTPLKTESSITNTSEKDGPEGE